MGNAWRYGVVILGLMWLLCCPRELLALGPDEVVVIANRHSVHSVQLARFYMEKRGIPRENLIQLAVADKEVCSREDYNTRVAQPVRRYLSDKDPENKIRCLVTVYGVPLKVLPPEIGEREKEDAKKLRRQLKKHQKALKGLGKQKSEQKEKLKKEIAAINRRLDALTQRRQRSSLDSELALVTAGQYDLSGWTPNPFFIGFRGKKLPLAKEDVKWVSRLDGPTPSVVRRIVEDGLDVEAKGLEGTAYFDARWVAPDKDKLKGYALYDKSIHRAAERVESTARMKVVLDDKEALFGPGQAPGAALYCGWYSLGQYVDAFKWQKGAVGYHIASAECITLKKKGSQVWCKRMLEEGVVATIGPTSEPYVQAFPLPEVFFGLLVDGRLTLAECYAVSLPYWSWQMVLVGDPLYRPFKEGIKHNR